MMKLAALILGFVVTGFAFANEPQDLKNLDYFLSKNQEPVHAEHLMRVSLCKDETLADCEEIAMDKYMMFHSFKNVDASPLQTVSYAEPSSELDELVKNSMYENERRFAHVG
jgi:hypothetical protein